MTINREELSTEIDRVLENNTRFLKSFIDKHLRIVLIGYGASSTIASHAGQDFEEAFPGKRIAVPSDGIHLLRSASKHGLNNVLQELVKKHVSEKDTLVILLAPGGDAEMLSRAAYYCAENFIPTVLITGCPSTNKLDSFDFPSKLLSVLIQSEDTKIVECVQMCLLHSVLD